MIEVEVKARSKPDTKQRIQDLGAKLVGVEHHCDAYFNSPLHDFKESDEALRIRVKDQGARLTYKGPKLDLKTQSRQEMTVVVDDPEAMENILTALGFAKSGLVKKVRTKYTLGQAVIALDEVEGLGSFIEVEMSGTDFGSDEVKADFANKRDRVMEILACMGLEELIRESYLELLSKSGHLI